MWGIRAARDGFLWEKKCGDEKLVGRAGVVKERVAGVVMRKMRFAGDGKYSVSERFRGRKWEKSCPRRW